MLHLAYFTNYAIQTLADRWRCNGINNPKYLHVFQESGTDTVERGESYHTSHFPIGFPGYVNCASPTGVSFNEGNAYCRDTVSCDVAELKGCASSEYVRNENEIITKSTSDPYEKFAYLLKDLNLKADCHKTGSALCNVMPSLEECDVSFLDEVEVDIRPSFSCLSVSELFEAILELGIGQSSHVVEKALMDQHVTIDDILTIKDVDHLTLLEKAVIYDSLDLANVILNKSTTEAVSMTETISSEWLQGTIHLAAFVGRPSMMKILLKACPSAAHVRGRVQLGAVSGPPGSLLDPYLTSQGSVDKVQQRLHWINTHCNELPICFSVCADNKDVTEILLSTENSKGINCDTSILELFTIACICDSVSCLPLICEKLPSGANSRDSQGTLIAIKGLSHGGHFLKALEENGLDLGLLKNVDQHGSNALHYLFKGISKQDKIYTKFSNLCEMTKFLVGQGIDVNQETGAFKSHGVSDTPLHLLLEHCNHVIGIDSKDYIRVTTRSRLQITFDRSLLQTINIILEAGYNKPLYINTLLQRVFENNNVWQRLANSNRFSDLKHQEYGLKNIRLVLYKLLKKKTVLTYKRRDTTPITLFLSGLYQSMSTCDILEKDSGKAFISVLRILLSSGISPNVYHLRSHVDWQQAPALFYFLQALIFQQKRNTCINDNILATVVEVCEVFCSYDSKFITSKLVNGRYVKCSIYDCLLDFLEPFIRARETSSVTDLEKVLDIFRKLLEVFLLWGADAVVYSPNWNHIRSAHNQKYALVQTWINLSQILEDSHEITSLLQYRDILDMLLNTAQHQDYQEALLSKFLHTNLPSDHPWVFRVMNLNPRPLTSLCRIALYHFLRRNYKTNIPYLPLPNVIRRYLISFDL